MSEWLYMVIQSSSIILKEIFRKIIWSRKCKQLFSDSLVFQSDDVFTLISLCIIVIVYTGFRAESSWKYR
jgi:hypothetical protein